MTPDLQTTAQMGNRRAVAAAVAMLACFAAVGLTSMETSHRELAAWLDGLVCLVPLLQLLAASAWLLRPAHHYLLPMSLALLLAASSLAPSVWTINGLLLSGALWLVALLACARGRRRAAAAALAMLGLYLSGVKTARLLEERSANGENQGVSAFVPP